MADNRYVLKDASRSSHQIILSILDDLAGGDLVDIGAWDGALGRQIRQLRRFRKLTALERDVDQIGNLARIFDQTILIDLEHVTRLPAADVVVMADVLEHLAWPEKLLGVASDSLANLGTVIISVPNVANLANRFSLFFGRFDYEDRGIRDRTHLRFYTLASARRLIRDAGFAIEREEASSIPLALAFPGLPRVILRLGERLIDALTMALPRLFGYQFIFVARRPDRP